MRATVLPKAIILTKVHRAAADVFIIEKMHSYTLPKVILIWDAPIPADRWQCSLWP